MKKLPSNAAIQGFTLVELMITVTILAILLALGMPALTSALAQQRVRTGAEGIMTGLQLARAQAVSRNTNVSFTLGSGSGWTVAVVDPAATIQARPANESGSAIIVTTADNNTAVTFTSLGEVSNFADPATLNNIVVSPPAGVTADSLQIDISAGGHIRMCNQSITAAGDPRRC